MGKDKSGLFALEDSSSSRFSNVSSARLSARFSRRKSLRVSAEEKIDNFLKIDIAPAINRIKDPEIAARAKPVAAPPEFKLHGYNDPNLHRHFGGGGLKGVVSASVAALFNTQDQPKDIHRTILLQPIVTGMQFDATRKPMLLLRCLADGAKGAIAFFKSNYILKQKIAELMEKKRRRISFYQERPSDDPDAPEERSDLPILKADLIMTGVIP